MRTAYKHRCTSRTCLLKYYIGIGKNKIFLIARKGDMNLFVVFHCGRPCDLSPLVCQNLHEKRLKVGPKMEKAIKSPSRLSTGSRFT